MGVFKLKTGCTAEAILLTSNVKVEVQLALKRGDGTVNERDDEFTMMAFNLALLAVEQLAKLE
jgi:hypothetical protein